ncbi:MAG: hypothetical protein O6758_00125, partial [Planctomycetota bacterium]|nr:hypothetical protein [Planctomycetota bacterium]
IFGRINESNQIAFAGFLNTDEIFGSQEGIWWERNGVLELLVAQDLPVPGIPGAVFSDLGFPGLRDDGSLIFVAEFEGSGIDFSNDFAVFRSDPEGSTDIILRTGDFVEIIDDEGNSDIRQVSPVFGLGAGISDTGERVFEIFFVDGSSGIYTANILRGKQPVPGDITGPGGVPDGCVDAFDLGAMLGAWCSAVNDPNRPSPPCENCIPANLALADISGPANVPDGCIDAFDLAKLLAEWCSVAGGNPCGTCFP